MRALPANKLRIRSLAQIVKIAISLSVLFTFGLAYYVPISVLWPMIRARIASKGPRLCRLYEISLRLAGVAASSKHVARARAPSDTQTKCRPSRSALGGRRAPNGALARPVRRLGHVHGHAADPHTNRDGD